MQTNKKQSPKITASQLTRTGVPAGRKKDAQVLEKGRPPGRHLDPKIDMFAHFDVIFSMFFRGCFLIDFLMVFW